MTHLGLFAGIGGFELATQWMGWQTIAWCEIDPFCQKVLKHHFPNATGHSDIKDTDFTIYRGRVDIITGGEPCQPHSIAGKRKGKDDDRYLWPEYFRAIKEILPSFIVNENVFGSISNCILDEKIQDLESIGYTCWTPFVIPACAVGSNHRRNRIWLIAHSQRQGLQGYNTQWENLRLNKKQAFTINSNTDVLEGHNLIEAYSTYLRESNGVCRGLDKHRIKALGNAVNPKIPFEIFKAIQFIMHNDTS